MTHTVTWQCIPECSGTIRKKFRKNSTHNQIQNWWFSKFQNWRKKFLSGRLTNFCQKRRSRAVDGPIKCPVKWPKLSAHARNMSGIVEKLSDNRSEEPNIIIDDWLISDLIPKKSKKLEFRKKFLTIFFSAKNWPEKWNFDIFCLRNFRKIAKLNSKFKSGINGHNFFPKFEYFRFFRN